MFSKLKQIKPWRWFTLEKIDRLVGLFVKLTTIVIVLVALDFFTEGEIIKDTATALRFIYISADGTVVIAAISFFVFLIKEYKALEDKESATRVPWV